MLVQIPLWTIVTPEIGIYGSRGLSSDSSMDDCNQGFPLQLAQKLMVQIPLWTIVTSLNAQHSTNFV